jgi:hypothetical protein
MMICQYTFILGNKTLRFNPDARFKLVKKRLKGKGLMFGVSIVDKWDVSSENHIDCFPKGLKLYVDKELTPSSSSPVFGGGLARS